MLILPRLNSSIVNPDLSRAFRVDAHLLAIIRIEDKRSKSEDFFSNFLFDLYIYKHRTKFSCFSFYLKNPYKCTC